MTKRGQARRFFEDGITQATDDCVLWPFSTATSGYPQLTVDGRKVYPHTAACRLSSGDPPPGTQARHLCGKALCFNPAHLTWGTAQNNADDRQRHGRTARGERGGLAKLTAEQVAEIRRRYTGARGEFTALGAEFGVSRLTISRVVSGTTWAQA